MELNDFIAGLNIFRKYYEKDHVYALGAEHDIIYVFPTPIPLDYADVGTLRQLGWFQPDVPETEDGNHGPYDPEESWAAFV